MEDTKASDAVCRICFDGDDSGDLVEPCGCSGSQAHVHEKCLQRWRRLQTFQGKHTAATRCEVCGQKYSASLAPPKRPVFALFHEYAHVLLETLWRLLICAITSPFALLSPIIFILVGFPCVLFGIWKGLVVSLAFFPLVVFSVLERTQAVSIWFHRSFLYRTFIIWSSSGWATTRNAACVDWRSWAF